MQKTMPASASSPRPVRLGLYGGTFDPVHHGHLIGARDALEQARLDAVVWIPCAQSPHKPGVAPTPAADRLALLRKALAAVGEPRFVISTIEISQPAPSYAIETVLTFRSVFPDAELFWIVGADQVAKLGTWKDAAALRRLVTFLVMDRPGTGPGLRLRLPKGQRIVALPSPRVVGISATEIRHRVKAGLPVAHLVPGPVAAHIAKRKLYR